MQNGVREKQKRGERSAKGGGTETQACCRSSAGANKSLIRRKTEEGKRRGKKRKLSGIVLDCLRGVARDLE